MQKLLTKCVPNAERPCAICKRLVCATYCNRLCNAAELTIYRRQQANRGLIADAAFQGCPAMWCPVVLQGYPTRVPVTRGGCAAVGSVPVTNHARVLQKLLVTRLVVKFCTSFGYREHKSSSFVHYFSPAEHSQKFATLLL